MAAAAASWRDVPYGMCPDFPMPPAPPPPPSLRQVHHARLQDGREVAVKVQYPGLAAAVAADLATMLSLSEAARWLFPGTSWRWLFEELSRRGGGDSGGDAAAAAVQVLMPVLSPPTLHSLGCSSYASNESIAAAAGSCSTSWTSAMRRPMPPAWRQTWRRRGVGTSLCPRWCPPSAPPVC